MKKKFHCSKKIFIINTEEWKAKKAEIFSTLSIQDVRSVLLGNIKIYVCDKCGHHQLGSSAICLNNGCNGTMNYFPAYQKHRKASVTPAGTVVDPNLPEAKQQGDKEQVMQDNKMAKKRRELAEKLREGEKLTIASDSMENGAKNMKRRKELAERLRRSDVIRYEAK